ncbi:MAG: hypothetical protein K940chlam1_00313 [Candidatus Anoxychlamydiales bacterium]|nr:hypothetical protein [Candidatus Anoxychlamydiales bacterium]NGX36205.1 hypothetical protein [Candidatus Anoxychlamydiales bacterium]
MAFFKNFIVVVILIGILTRIALYLYTRKIRRDISIFLAFFTVGIIILPIVSIFLGFDIAVSEYVVALIIWLLFDLIRIKTNLPKKFK